MAITKATASSIAPAAKGDLVVGSATNDAAVLGVGSNDQVLTADSSTATGLKWATASSGMTLITTLSPSAVTSVSADNVFTSTYNNYIIFGFITIQNNDNFNCRIRSSGSDITSDYYQDTTGTMGGAGDRWYICDNRDTNMEIGFTMNMMNLGNSDLKIGNFNRTHDATTGTYVTQGLRNKTFSVTDGIKFFPSSGNISGRIYIYGLAK